MSLKETLLAAWKFCLSFRKSDWVLNDYPVILREQKPDLDFVHRAARFEPQRYLARVVKWGVLTGFGGTPEEAKGYLAVRFETVKSGWQRQGKPLPRPGTNVLLNSPSPNASVLIRN